MYHLLTDHFLLVGDKSVRLKMKEHNTKLLVVNVISKLGVKCDSYVFKNKCFIFYRQ